MTGKNIRMSGVNFKQSFYWKAQGARDRVQVA